MAARLSKSVAVLGVIVVILAGIALDAPNATAATISQASSQTGAIDVNATQAFSTTVAVTGNSVPVTFSVTSSPSTPGLLMNDATGEITTTGTLPVSGSPYVISGNDSDADGDSGSWSFSLTVTGDTISQASGTSDSVNVNATQAFSTTVAVTGNSVPVTFSVTSSPSTPGLLMNDATGEITTTGTLPVSGSPYVISGNDSDADGDSGSWSFSLTVTGDTISQASGTSDSVNVNATQAFSTTVAVTGNSVPVTFSVTSSPSTPGLLMNDATGEITTTGTLPVSGSPYVISGNDSDADGDSGSWSFSLAVEPNGTAVSITQTSATAGTTASASSAAFAPGSIEVGGNVGPVTFVTTVSSPGLSVSGAGAITTTGTLSAGNYTVTGTDSDTHGDTGTWTYTLTVTAVVTTVTFNSNEGTGSMEPENDSVPTPLTLNAFTRVGYSFVDWNTMANGSGTSYANGSSYSFDSSITLYAQWKLGKAVRHTVMFNGNAGSGAMPPERENTPTALSANSFTRTGYSFVDWNTKASGSGVNYANGATYSFKSSVTLYAVWKKKISKPKTFTVTFNAHGGKGSMIPEHHSAPAALSANGFTRVGYSFEGWNTSTSGSGVNYANGATYSFKSSITLYAQWKARHVESPPAIDAVATVGPFARKSSSLTSALEVEVSKLADEMRANHDTKVTLVGYGDELTASDELNEATWAANFALSQRRAGAVDAYLSHALSALGLSGFAISAEGNGSSTPGPGASSLKQSNSGLVIAKLN